MQALLLLLLVMLLQSTTPTTQCRNIIRHELIRQYKYKSIQVYTMVYNKNKLSKKPPGEQLSIVQPITYNRTHVDDMRWKPINHFIQQRKGSQQTKSNR